MEVDTEVLGWAQEGSYQPEGKVYSIMHIRSLYKTELTMVRS